MANLEEKKPIQNENDSRDKQPEHASNWITDMYDLPEWAKLQRNTSQRGLLIASYKRVKKRL